MPPSRSHEPVGRGKKRALVQGPHTIRFGQEPANPDVPDGFYLDPAWLVESQAPGDCRRAELLRLATGPVFWEKI